MTNSQMITFARLHLTNGNLEAYKRLMASNLRSSMSTRSTNVFMKALKQDNVTL